MSPIWYRRPGGWSYAIPAYLLIASVFCYLGIGGYGYVAMEPMVIDASQHMLDAGDWLIPYVYGELYTYKPPLTYWLAAMTTAQFEGAPPEWLFRLPFATCALLLGLAVLVLIGRRVGAFGGMLCALATIGSALYLEQARLGDYDIAITLFVGLSVLLAIIALTDEKPKPLHWPLAYIALFLGLLAKGMPALMAYGPGLLLAAFFTGRARRLLAPGHMVAVIMFIALVGAYVWSVVQAVGWTGFALPAQEAQARGLTWDWERFGLTFAKPLLVAVAFAPFTVFLPRAWTICRSGQRSQASSMIRAAAGFAIGGVIAFVIVPTLEMRYFMPLATSFGVVCGLTAHTAIDGQPSRFEVLAIRVIAVLLVVFVPLTAIKYQLHMPIVIALCLLAIAILWSATRTPAKGTWSLRNVVLVTVFMSVAVAYHTLPNRSAKRSLASVAKQVQEIVPPGEALCTNGPADAAGKYGSLFTYLGREVRVLGGPDDTDFSWCIFWNESWRKHYAGQSVDFERTIVHPYNTFHLIHRSRPAKSFEAVEAAAFSHPQGSKNRH